MHTDELELRTKDGLTLTGKIWRPEGEPKKIICLVHGHGEHIGRYEHFAAHFVECGIALFAVDLRGHGKSEGKRGHAPSYDLLMSDVEELVKAARVEYNDTPIILYGHSMGGNLVAGFILQNNMKELEAAVLSSPWLTLAFDPPSVQVKLAKFVRKLLPSFTQHSKLDVQLLSKDPEVIKAYQEDPLVHDLVSPSLFLSIIKGGQDALSKASELKLPTLVMHGDDDKITSADSSGRFARDAGAEYKLWKGLKHEPHNEPEQKEVLTYVSDWILKK
ncbi:MAG: alpha/beta hydrolase [Cyclobacteriaceae bacterium]